MFGIFSSIIGWFGSKVLGNIFSGEKGGLLDRVIGVIDKRVTDEVEREKLKTEVTVKYIQAQVDSSVVRKDAFGPWFALMAFLFLPGPVLWWTAVFIDSTFPFLFPGWDPLALPKDFYPWFGSIIGAIFVIPTINKFVSK